MKNILHIIAALALILSVGATGFAAGGKSVITVELDANPSTGFEWVCFPAGGDSAEADAGNFISSDANHDKCGAPGTTTYTITPVKEGHTVFVFEYARPWENNEPAMRRIMLVEVDGSLKMSSRWLPESSIITGKVTELSENEALIATDNGAVYTAAFPEEMQLPAVNEQVKIYTDGTMGMSEPPFISVMGWESIPGENAR